MEERKENHPLLKIFDEEPDVQLPVVGSLSKGGETEGRRGWSTT